jgi:hypothetical protein
MGWGRGAGRFSRWRGGDGDLTLPDAEDEDGQVPHLQRAGVRLIFRDALGGDAHRQLPFAAPNANLHVWDPGAIEPQRTCSSCDG